MIGGGRDYKVRAPRHLGATPRDAHDQLPMRVLLCVSASLVMRTRAVPSVPRRFPRALRRDRKSTRLNSSHGYISYAVFCLKKKKDYGFALSYSNEFTCTIVCGPMYYAN